MVKIGWAMEPGPKNQDLLVANRNSFDKNNKKGYDFFAVIDGHGESNVAADITAQNISEACYNEISLMPMDEDIVQGFHRVNTQIHYKMREQKIHRSGAAAACLFVTGGMAKLAWVGDARIAILNEKNSIAYVSEEHNLTTNARERLRINHHCSNSMPRQKLMENPKWQELVAKARAEGRILRSKSFLEMKSDKFGHFKHWVVVAHEGGIALKLSRTLGDLNAARCAIAEPQLFTLSFGPTISSKDKNGVKFILATATFWSVFKPKKVSSFFKRFDWEKGNLESKAKQLVSQAKSRRFKRGFPEDDISLMLVFINGVTLSKSISQAFTSINSGSVTEFS